MLLSAPLHAQNEDLLWLGDESERINGHDKQQDLVLKTTNSDTDWIISEHSVYDDSSMLSFLVHGNLKLNNIASLKTFELDYGKKISRYSWLLFTVSKLAGNFGSVSENKSSGDTTNSLSEINFQRPDESEVNLLSLGVGLSYRYKFFPKIFNFNKVFETVGAMITYNQLDDQYRGMKYSGPGLRVDYGVHKRISRVFQLGLQASYNIALVKRSAEFDTEKTSDRSLLLSWGTIAFNLSFYL
jgi:hypothetical protein